MATASIHVTRASTFVRTTSAKLVEFCRLPSGATYTFRDGATVIRAIRVFRSRGKMVFRKIRDGATYTIAVV